MKYFFTTTKKRKLRRNLYKNQIKQSNTCEECKGIGLIRYEDIFVNGIQYKPCSPEGNIRMPYDECNKCYGTGIIEKQKYI